MTNAPPPHQDARGDAAPPLWSIGLAVAVMLIVPLVLYSIAPAGPVREGDTVFLNGAHTVRLVGPSHYREGRFGDSCLLDSRDPLLVLQRLIDRPDATILAKVQGKMKIEFPFCPPQAEVLLKDHQVDQKPELFAELRDRLSNLLSR